MTALDDIHRIAGKRDLEAEHSDAVMNEAARWQAEPGIDDPSLVDLTHLPFCSIDEEHSKDLDQALFLEQTDGGFTVWYAIADAAYYVRPGSALLTEAIARGSTFYLPGLVVPMLPKVLSEDIVSINPDVDRRALVFKVSLDESGMLLGTDVMRARVHSRLKTWYDAVQAWFDGYGELPCGDDVKQSLRVLAQVGELRMDAAEERDVVQYRRAEMMVELKGERREFVAMADPRNECERYNEQISLMCNMEGARLLRENASDHVQAVFRTHAAPAAERMRQLDEQIDSLIKAHKLDRNVWAWDRQKRSLRRYLDGLPNEGSHGRIAEAIHRQAMMSGGSAIFQSAPGIHFGVGADEYARFTAPMREVVGIFTHKEAWEALGVVSPEPDAADEMLREGVIAAAQRSRQLQRELDREVNRLVLDQLFTGDTEVAKDERPIRRGTVMGITRNKVHIQLDAPPIDVKLYHRHLEAQLKAKLFTTADQAVLRRKRGGAAVLVVGDQVDIRVAQHDRERDRWELELVFGG